MDEQCRSKFVKALMKNEMDTVNKLIAVAAPKSLFKYRYGEQRDIEALKENKVWIGRAIYLDDSEDARFRVKNTYAICRLFKMRNLRIISIKEMFYPLQIRVKKTVVFVRFQKLKRMNICGKIMRMGIMVFA